MPPPKKKVKTTHQADKGTSVLRADFRTAWPLKTGEESVSINVQDEIFTVHGKVLGKHSEYFQAATKPCYKESAGEIVFDNIDPKYFALFLGVAYSYSSIVPHATPAPATNPEAQKLTTPLRDYVEVYKLCDRFICPTMSSYLIRCIKSAIGDCHRALFRTPLDESQQVWYMKDFADAFEALDRDQLTQKDIGTLMIEYFCEGVNFRTWQNLAEELNGRPMFVLHVSRYFGGKLAHLMETRVKPKRKELKCP